MEMAQVVAKKLVMEIVPIFDLPISLGSDSGPAFMAKLSQLLSFLNWKLYCMYHHQRAGKVERMNRTLKEVSAKYIFKTGG